MVLELASGTGLESRSELETALALELSSRLSAELGIVPEIALESVLAICPLLQSAASRWASAILASAQAPVTASPLERDFQPIPAPTSRQCFLLSRTWPATAYCPALESLAPQIFPPPFCQYNC